jgi:hypothetical protein
LNKELYLLVGRHTIQGDQTLQQAGVTRDCHVRVLTRCGSTLQQHMLLAPAST